MKKPMLGALTGCLLATSAWSSIPEANYTQDLLLVKLKDSESLPEHACMKQVRNLFANVYSVKVENFIECESFLKDSGSFEYVERNFKSPQRELATPVYVEADAIEGKANPFNDPQVSRVWSFRSSSRYGVSVNDAYNQMTQYSADEQIIVAVVDTGVDANHEDLKDVMWVNAGEIPGNNIDDDGNGYIDDVHGINTIIRGGDGKPTGDIRDTHSHGTHVSGTIGAKQNNNKGIAGIASNVKIMGIRTVPNSGDETDVNVVESFIYAAKNGAKIINCSFGKKLNENGMAVRDAINHIGEEYGTLVVAAAGNSSLNIDRNLRYPASFDSPNLIVVASTSSYGNMSYFSNYGAVNVDVAAPGSGIHSTVPNNRYMGMSGTSMAAPTTSGVLAEIMSRFPDMDHVQVKNLLIDSVSKVRSFSGKMVSGGRIDLLNALKGASNL